MKLSKSWYTVLEMNHSNTKPQRPASEDILDMMRLAVNTNDKEWFNELSNRYNQLKVEEELMKAELGFIG
jgi:hypothetical protein